MLSRFALATAAVAVAACGASATTLPKTQIGADPCPRTPAGFAGEPMGSLTSARVVMPETLPAGVSVQVVAKNSLDDMVGFNVSTSGVLGDASTVALSAVAVNGELTLNVTDLVEFAGANPFPEFPRGEEPEDVCDERPVVIVEVQVPTDFCWTRADDDINQITFVPGAKCVRVLHINDFHAYVEGTTGGACKDDDDFCDGGWALMFTMVKQLADAAPGRTVFVDNGDQFLGTPWSTVYQGEDSKEFLNLLCDYANLAGCVGNLGNHEFDYGYDKAASYVAGLDFPVVNSNIQDNCAEKGFALGNALNQTYEMSVGDYTLGFVGYVTVTTKDTSSAPDCVSFEDETTAANAAIAELQLDDVDFVVALSHSGLPKDEAMATAGFTTKPDLIIGGHSHSLLWNDAQLGPTQNSRAQRFPPRAERGKSSPYLVNDIGIVQAASYSQYLGGVDIIFNDDDTVTMTPVQQFLKGGVIPEDADAKEKITQLLGEVQTLRERDVATTEVFLDGQRETVRTGESNMGALICDAMIQRATADIGRPVDFCLMNGGGIRAPIAVGDVSFGDVITVLPFGNLIGITEVTGHDLHLIAEHGVSGAPEAEGRFCHIGGFKIEYDSSVKAACGPDEEIWDTECVGDVAATRIQSLTLPDGTAIKDDDSQTFLLATNDFLLRGGDSYAMLPDTNVVLGTGAPLDEAFAALLENLTPITADDYELGRIVDVAAAAPTAEPTDEPEPGSGLSTGASIGILVGVIVAVSAVCVVYGRNPPPPTAVAEDDGMYQARQEIAQEQALKSSSPAFNPHDL